MLSGAEAAFARVDAGSLARDPRAATSAAEALSFVRAVAGSATPGSDGILYF